MIHIIPLLKNGFKITFNIVLGIFNSFCSTEVIIVGKVNLNINIIIPIIKNDVDKYFKGLIKDHVNSAIKK